MFHGLIWHQSCIGDCPWLKQKAPWQQAMLHAQYSRQDARRRLWNRFRTLGSQFQPPPSCWDSPAKVNEFRLAKCSKSQHERICCDTCINRKRKMSSIDCAFILIAGKVAHYVDAKCGGKSRDLRILMFWLRKLDWRLLRCYARFRLGPNARYIGPSAKSSILGTFQNLEPRSSVLLVFSMLNSLASTLGRQRHSASTSTP